jgi:hypothetical protein
MRTLPLSFTARFVGLFPVTRLADDPFISAMPAERQDPLLSNKTRWAFLLLAMAAGLQGCVTLTEEDRERIAYDLNEARVVYEERRAVCLYSGAHFVTESLTGSRRLSISEMKWAYCNW